MSLFDLVSDLLVGLLPGKVQLALVALLLIGVTLLFGIGWYFSTH